MKVVWHVNMVKDGIEFEAQKEGEIPFFPRQGDRFFFDRSDLGGSFADMTLVVKFSSWEVVSGTATAFCDVRETWSCNAIRQTLLDIGFKVKIIS